MGDATEAPQVEVESVPVDVAVIDTPSSAPDLDPTAPATDYVPGHALLEPATASVTASGGVDSVEATLQSLPDGKAPVEGKVWSSTIGAGVGAPFATLLLWLGGVLIWGAPAGADHALQAVAAVPSPVAVVVGTVVPAAVAFVGGYIAKHTPRPS